MLTAALGKGGSAVGAIDAKGGELGMFYSVNSEGILRTIDCRNARRRKGGSGFDQNDQVLSVDEDGSFLVLLSADGWIVKLTPMQSEGAGNCLVERAGAEDAEEDLAIVSPI
jgi:hypothetical protein